MPSELREALLAANASALIPKIIDPLLLEYQRRYSPLCRALPSTKWDSDTYYFNQRTQLATGGFVADGGALPVSNSTYVQNNFKMTHLQVVGAVTGYAQEVTRQVIGDLRQTEIEGAIRGIYWDVETAMLWANAASTQFGARPQFDGFDSQIATFTCGNQNAQDKAGGSLTLAMLDELIDMVESNAAMSVFDDSWMLLMSNTANSKIAQLLVSQQRFVDQVEIAAGLLVPTYRDIPIIKSSFLSTRNLSMGTVTSATATTGGTLAAATYSYKVSAICARQGEIAASAEVSQATTGSTSTITLSFSTPTGFEGSQPQLYRVWRSTSTGTETFLGYVDATVGLQADGVTPILTTSIIDTGATLVPQNGSTVPAQYPASYVGTNTGLFPPAVGLENIYLTSRDRDNVIRPYVREVSPLDVYPTTTSPDTLPFAVITDTTLAIRAPKYAGRLARVGVAV